MPRLPAFPGLCNYWGPGLNPLTNPPSQANLPYEKVTGARHTLLHAHGLNNQVPEVWIELWFPAATAGLQASSTNPGSGGGTLEAPAGSGRYYYLRVLDYEASDFPNEFIAAWANRNSTTTSV